MVLLLLFDGPALEPPKRRVAGTLFWETSSIRSSCSICSVSSSSVMRPASCNLPFSKLGAFLLLVSSGAMGEEIRSRADLRSREPEFTSSVAPGGAPSLSFTDRGGGVLIEF